ncbi:MAG: hypothetical protein MZV70_58990 [Desulfobacterales bacterium]|nr:hypothetical protein [Desulfobacterales bacterium]
MTMRYIWLLAVFVCFLAAACSSDSGNSGQTVARSALARDMTPQVSDEELAAVVSGNTEFTLKLFPLLDENPNNNYLFLAPQHHAGLCASGAGGAL